MLDAALEHSCKSVTTCFLGKEGAKSKEIIGAVRHLMGVFWDTAQMRPLALIYQACRSIFGRCMDPDGYWHSHNILEEAIEEAKTSSLGKKLSSQELIDNMKMLYFAGTETTGSLLTTLLGHLAARPEEQEIIRAELLK